jgi:hypothetical protein
MYYAISDLTGKWVILKGGPGCSAGQGNVIVQDLTTEEMEEQIKELRKESSSETTDGYVYSNGCKVYNNGHKDNKL